MYKKELALLKKLKNLIEKSPRNEHKLLLIGDFDNLANILCDLEILSDTYQMDELGKEYLWFSKELEKAFRANDQKYLDSIEIISSLNDELRIYDKQYPIIEQERSINTEIDKKIMNELLKTFLQELDSDLYDLFNSLVTKKQIFISNSCDLVGATYGFNNRDISPYILIQNSENEFLQYTTLVHELGHCYELYHNQHNLGLTCKYPLSEVISISLEKIFLNYLIANNVYSEKVFKEKIRWRFLINQMNLSACFSNYAINNNSAHFEDDGLIETDFDFSFPKDLDEDIETAILFCEPSFSNYCYVLSDIIANNFVELYPKDPKACLQELKRYMMTGFKSDLKDTLKQYGDLGATKREIKQLFKYQR